MRGCTRALRHLLSPAFVTLLAGPAFAQAATPALADRLADAVPVRMAADGVPGAVLVLIEGDVPVWTGAFGLADPATGRAMTEDALFRVESISKPVTAWGVMQLAQAGQLDLDAPVRDCLTSWQPPEGTPPITAWQLLSHSAGVGLGDYAARYAPDAPRPDLPEHLAEDFAMIAEPVAGFAYSDTGYNLLELAIEDCTGEVAMPDGYPRSVVVHPLPRHRRTGQQGSGCPDHGLGDVAAEGGAGVIRIAPDPRDGNQPEDAKPSISRDPRFTCVACDS